MVRNLYKLKIYKIFVATTAVFLLLPGTQSAGAQTAPQFMVSWQAQSYAPSWYQGKIFPTKNTAIDIGFNLVDNGKLADLSKTVVRWYVNDGLIKNENNGLGIQSLQFNVLDYGGGETQVRISLPDYKGGAPLDYIIHIPVLSPEVVIQNNSATRQLQAGQNSFSAAPFFFNVPDLSRLAINWSANGSGAQGTADNPWVLNLNIDSGVPSGFAVDINAVVNNVLNQLEFAARDIQFVVK